MTITRKVTYECKIQTRFESRSIRTKLDNNIQSNIFSLQQINQILHEKIDAQARQKSTNNNYMVDKQSCGTQTMAITDKTSCITSSVCTQTEPKSPAVSPAPKPAPTKKSIKSVTSTKEETHLLTTIRGMRVDLAIKEKALQRLTRELDECKKTIKKLQKENESK